MYNRQMWETKAEMAKSLRALQDTISRKGRVLEVYERLGLHYEARKLGASVELHRAEWRDLHRSYQALDARA